MYYFYFSNIIFLDLRSPTPTTSGSGTARSSSSGTPRSSSSSGVQRNGWTVTPQTKREHSVPTSSVRDTGKGEIMGLFTGFQGLLTVLQGLYAISNYPIFVECLNYS